MARSKEPLERLAAEHPDRVLTLSGDLADFSIGARAAEIAHSTWGRIDGLVVNHGVLEPVKKMGDTDADEWRTAFDINVFSAVSLVMLHNSTWHRVTHHLTLPQVKAALPALRASNGRIILVSSGASVTAYPGWGAYGATKAALNHMAQTLANEEPDVTTLSIRPGVVDTDMQTNIRSTHHKNMDPKDAEKFLGLKSGGKLLKPEQPGNVMARLVLDAPKELSGKFLKYVDLYPQLLILSTNKILHSWNDQAILNFQDV